jgi:hypothetical protein
VIPSLRVICSAFVQQLNKYLLSSQNIKNTSQYRNPTAQFTVVQKPYQGTPGKHAVYCFPVAFFGTFFSTKKSTEKQIISTQTTKPYTLPLQLYTQQNIFYTQPIFSTHSIIFFTHSKNYLTHNKIFFTHSLFFLHTAKYFLHTKEII